eukprot:3186482-Karenia_brevis.AAC.1
MAPQTEAPKQIRRSLENLFQNSELGNSLDQSTETQIKTGHKSGIQGIVTVLRSQFPTWMGK